MVWCVRPLHESLLVYFRQCPKGTSDKNFGEDAIDIAIIDTGNMNDTIIVFPYSFPGISEWRAPTRPRTRVCPDTQRTSSMSVTWCLPVINHCFSQSVLQSHTSRLPDNVSFDVLGSWATWNSQDVKGFRSKVIPSPWRFWFFWEIIKIFFSTVRLSRYMYTPRQI